MRNFSILLICLAVILPCCSATEQRIQMEQSFALPISNAHATALEAEDIVKIMLNAGFDDETILELGTDIRNKLADPGAVRIFRKGVVEAIMCCSTTLHSGGEP